MSPRKVERLCRDRILLEHFINEIVIRHAGGASLRRGAIPSTRFRLSERECAWIEGHKCMRRTNRRGSGSTVQKAAEAKANSDRAQNTDANHEVPKVDAPQLSAGVQGISCDAPPSDRAYRTLP